MILLILASLAVAALPSSSLPKFPLGTHQPEKTEVAEKNVETEDTTGDDVEKNYKKYVKLCTSLGITPITLGSGYTAPYPSYGGSYYGTSYPAYSGYSGNAGYPAYIYPSSGYNVYYRGNAAGRSAESETSEDSTEGNVEEDFREYLKLCSNLGLPSIPLSSAYSSPYSNYGGYGVSSNYGHGYTGSGGYNGYNGYSAYPSYPYAANYVNPVYYRGNAAGRSARTETAEDSTKEDVDNAYAGDSIKEDIDHAYADYLRLCSNLGLPSIPLSSAYSSPYSGGSSNYGYSGYGGSSGYRYPVGNSGYNGYGNSGYTNYPAYGYSSNSGYGYGYGR